MIDLDKVTYGSLSFMPKFLLKSIYIESDNLSELTINFWKDGMKTHIRCKVICEHLNLIKFIASTGKHEQMLLDLMHNSGKKSGNSTYLDIEDELGSLLLIETMLLTGFIINESVGDGYDTYLLDEIYPKYDDFIEA